jgi:hypothetical protein
MFFKMQRTSAMCQIQVERECVCEREVGGSVQE